MEKKPNKVIKFEIEVEVYDKGNHPFLLSVQVGDVTSEDVDDKANDKVVATVTKAMVGLDVYVTTKDELNALYIAKIPAIVPLILRQHFNGESDEK